jgi:hypothetical protein
MQHNAIYGAMPIRLGQQYTIDQMDHTVRTLNVGQYEVDRSGI